MATVFNAPEELKAAVGKDEYIGTLDVHFH